MTQVVLLVDDNAAFRDSTAWLLGGLGYDVRAYGSADELLAQADSLQILNASLCVLTDLRMPGKDGLQLHDALNARGLRWPVVYMSGHGDVPLAVAAMRKGAVSFLEKPFRDSALEETLAEAFRSGRGRTVPDGGSGNGTAHVATDSLATAAGVPSPATQGGSPTTATRLTPRERQVLELVVKGSLNKTIADTLGISIKTVELHRANMMQKMGARSITELMRCVLTGERGSR